MHLSCSSSETCILWASERGETISLLCALYRSHERSGSSLFSLLSVLCMGKVRSNNSSLLARGREDTLFNKQLKTCRSTQFYRRGARILADAALFLWPRVCKRGQAQKSRADPDIDHGRPLRKK